MKRKMALFFALLLLTGCSGKNQELQRAMDIRTAMQGKTARFSADITADYGDMCYTFSMDCECAPDGALSFTVTAPDTISGIKGSVSAAGGELRFEELALAFESMAEGRISPISAPWVMTKALRSGYLTACANEDSLLRISVDDSFADNALKMDIWVDDEDCPVRAEILWEGRRLLTILVKDFVLS